MKKLFYLFLVILFCLMHLLPTNVNAHPGRTDSNGGHTCRTNCEEWGLEYGEYHYHNDGESGSSSGSSNSDSNSSTDSETNPSSESNSSSGSSSEQSSNSNNSKNIESDSQTSDSKPKPQIDEKQQKANEHYKKANNYYNSSKYHDALDELNKIYKLEKNDSQTDTLVKQSLVSIYEVAETSLDDEDYDKSKELLDFILNYKHSNKEVKQKANELLEKISVVEEIANLLSDVNSAMKKKNYEEELTLIQEAYKIKETKEISKTYDKIIKNLTNDAETAYGENEFDEAYNLYTLLEQNIDSKDLKNHYQLLIHKIEDLQLIQTNFGLEADDFDGDSLFNHLIMEENETTYNQNVVDEILSYIVEKEKEVVNFIFNIDIKELLDGGQKNAA